MIFNTRIAPSPTGMMHLGTARTAYFAYLAARASGGKFLLRIDDTDASRNSGDAVKVIFDAMNWLGLDYDYTFNQSYSPSSYLDVAHSLVNANLAYLDDGCIKLALDYGMPNYWVDDNSGPVNINDNDRKLINGLILIKSDNTPTYHFASTVDDYLCDINLVIRGTDHIANTAKHIAILNALDMLWGTITATTMRFAHVGLIMHKVDGVKKKMSKRDDDCNIMNYKDYNSDAVLNYMLRLGWSPSDANFDKHNKFITKDMAIDMFLTKGNMRSAPSLFDKDTLDRYNRIYKAKNES